MLNICKIGINSGLKPKEALEPSDDWWLDWSRTAWGDGNAIAVGIKDRI